MYYAEADLYLTGLKRIWIENQGATVPPIAVYNIQCASCITDLMHGSTLMISKFHFIAHMVHVYYTDACMGLFELKVLTD